ncbi:putative RNA exonuclease Rex3 [Phyllosticta citrichinensis]|uniref:RNA exonuclease Rex3 n=1 Tax=Phyllosticta citrichinensis TaxID=1130410 RepID=A0ABR1XPY8_9PEZI
MWTSKGLFKEIICPMGAACRMPNCIFGHDFFGTTPSQDSRALESMPRFKPLVEKPSTDHVPEPKKRKIDHNDDSTSLPPQQPAKKAFVGGLVGSDKSNTNAKETLTKTRVSKSTNNSPKRLATVQRPISPPPKSTQQKPKVSATGTGDIKKESLNPRPIKGEPAQWAVRYALLQKLHEAMSLVNKKAKESSDTELHTLVLGENELIKAALDEEEHLAKTQGKVYRNVTGQRVMSYKKMKVEDWKAHLVKAKTPATHAETETKTPQHVDTGLSPEQETMFLSRLTTSQTGLDRHGYVTKVPSSEEIEEAKQAVKWVANWEVCDRCATRFQVFPDRREDGALTTGGHCTYHPGKVMYPQRKKTDNITGREEPRYMCCREPQGSRGCVTVNTHVFKVADGKRMAAIMPFVETPPNPNPIKNKAVCFDCEMGYTVYGLEVIRLTATSWPDGESLIDVLVRPLGTVLDLNTRYSGVTPDQFFSAPEYDATDPASSNPRASATKNGAMTLRIVSSPGEARALLLSHISPETPLLGHALENDLNVMRLVHPTIIDTVMLFPHVKGLPIRHSLKALAKRELGREIQTAGAAGHDSLEDARSTGELIRAKVAKEWRKLQDAGWTVTPQGFCPPEGTVAAQQPLASAQLTSEKSSDAKKRSFPESEGAGNEASTV